MIRSLIALFYSVGVTHSPKYLIRLTHQGIRKSFLYCASIDLCIYAVFRPKFSVIRGNDGLFEVRRSHGTARNPTARYPGGAEPPVRVVEWISQEAWSKLGASEWTANP